MHFLICLQLRLREAAYSCSVLITWGSWCTVASFMQTFTGELTSRNEAMSKAVHVPSHCSQYTVVCLSWLCVCLLASLVAEHTSLSWNYCKSSPDDVKMDKNAIIIACWYSISVCESEGILSLGVFWSTYSTCQIANMHLLKKSSCVLHILHTLTKQRRLLVYKTV